MSGGVLLGLALLALRGPGVEGDTLALSTAVREALADHPSVRAAGARMEEADGELRRLRGDRLPALTVQGELTRFELPMVVAPLHAFDPTRAPEFDETLVRSRVHLSWLLFDGGSARASVRGGQAERDARGWSLEDTEALLVEGTVAAYLGVAIGRTVLAASRERTRALEAEVERVERLLAVGRAAPVEGLRAEAALREAAAEQASAMATLRVREGVLARLIGRSPEEVGAVEVGLPLIRDGMRERSARRSPALMAARDRVRAAEAATEAARAARLPRVEAVAGLSQYGGGGSSTTAEWDAGLRLSWPVFTGGRTAGAEEAAVARLRAARESLAVLELELTNDEDRARAAEEEARARGEALQAAVAALEEVARIEALALDAGSGVQRDFLEAQASLLAARAALAEAEAAVILARVTLARVRGELTSRWLLEHVEGAR